MTEVAKYDGLNEELGDLLRSSEGLFLEFDPSQTHLRRPKDSCLKSIQLIQIVDVSIDDKEPVKVAVFERKPFVSKTPENPPKCVAAVLLRHVAESSWQETREVYVEARRRGDKLKVSDALIAEELVPHILDETTLVGPTRSSVVFPVRPDAAS